MKFPTKCLFFLVAIDNLCKKTLIGREKVKNFPAVGIYRTFGNKK